MNVMLELQKIYLTQILCIDENVMEKIMELMFIVQNKNKHNKM
jgi:hypothetical protein